MFVYSSISERYCEKKVDFFFFFWLKCNGLFADLVRYIQSRTFLFVWWQVCQYILLPIFFGLEVRSGNTYVPREVKVWQGLFHFDWKCSLVPVNEKSLGQKPKEYILRIRNERGQIAKVKNQEIHVK